MLAVGMLENWVDLAAALAVGLFFLYGVIRGLTIQLVGLVVLLAALAAGSAAAPVIGSWIRRDLWEQVSPTAGRGIGFVLVTLLVLGIASLAFHLVFGKFPARPRLPLDRLLGGLLGGAKGALVVMAVVLLVVNVLWDAEDDETPSGLLRAFLDSSAADATRWVSRRLAHLLPEGASLRVVEYAGPLEECREFGK